MFTYPKSLRVVVLSSLLLIALVFLTAAGASPLQTQNVQVGPYPLLLSFYSLPRAGQELSMTIEAGNTSAPVSFSQATLRPAPGTDANTINVQMQPSSDDAHVYTVSVNPPIRGKWLLHFTVTGGSGATVANIPLDVQGPPVIPTWLGWLIGLIPLPILIGFIWVQVGWRKKQREQVQREMQEKPAF